MTKLKTIEKVMKKMTLEQKIAFGILCALETYQGKEYLKWSKDWFSGKDRTRESALKIAITAVPDGGGIAAEAAWAVAWAAKNSRKGIDDWEAAGWAARAALFTARELGYSVILKCAKEAVGGSL